MPEVGSVVGLVLVQVSMSHGELGISEEQKVQT